MNSDIKIFKKEFGYCSICGEKHEFDLCEKLVPNIIKDERVDAIEHYYRNCLNAYDEKMKKLKSINNVDSK